MSEPGLVKREILPCEKEGHVLVREVWDVTVPGCPMLVLKPGPTWPLEQDPDARVVVRTVLRPLD
ncbi:MAG: hypothetical protein GEU95_01175 [Rhizobiales bacterium]|nr:hypothetical protein [Hyphomicrobiales bacterium]